MHDVLVAAGLDLADVTVVATRARFERDERLALGPPVVTFPDDELVAASEQTEREVGIPARVAETAARLAAGPTAVVGPVLRSAHVVAALAVAGQAGRRRSR